MLQGKVGSAFTSVGGHGRGFGGHEAILQSFHATFLQHGMVSFVEHTCLQMQMSQPLLLASHH